MNIHPPLTILPIGRIVGALILFTSVVMHYWDMSKFISNLFSHDWDYSLSLLSILALFWVLIGERSCALLKKKDDRGHAIEWILLGQRFEHRWGVGECLGSIPCIFMQNVLARRCPLSRITRCEMVHFKRVWASFFGSNRLCVIQLYIPGLFHPDFAMWYLLRGL
jgi:hypothetical protein